MNDPTVIGAIIAAIAALVGVLLKFGGDIFSFLNKGEEIEILKEKSVVDQLRDLITEYRKDRELDKADIKSLREEIDEVKETRKTDSAEINNLRQRISILERTLTERDAIILEKDKVIAQQSTDLNVLKERVTHLEEILKQNGISIP